MDIGTGYDKISQNLERLTADVCSVARQACEYIGEERRRFDVQKVERKHEHDYVSYVDKHSEKLIVDALERLLPEAGFVTEEGSASYDSEEYCWVVDPLDGTTNFIHNYAPYCVSIALCQGRTILLGVVCEVTTGKCYYAWQGGGAWRDGCRLHVGQSAMNDALLCIQLPYNSEAYRPVVKRLIGSLYGHVGSIRMIGSAAMALCYVAEGCLDGYAEKYIGQWDYMAGALIVSEAGGIVTDYEGSTEFTQGSHVVAASRAVHKSLLQAVQEASFC